MVNRLNKTSVIVIEEKFTDKTILIDNQEPFKLYQYFKILDKDNKNPICKIIRCHAIKKLKDIDNQTILKNATTLGFDLNEVFYWAEVIVEKELITSISPDATVVKIEEGEMYQHLYPKNTSGELVLGEIRGTEAIYKELKDKEYTDKLVMAKDWNIEPQTCLPLIFDYYKLQQSPNIGIFGNSGSGKTFTLKSMIEEFIINEVPSIVFDPHNEFDFSQHMDGLPDKFKHDFNSRVEIMTAGKDFAIRFTDLSNESFKNFIKNLTTLSDPQELAIEEIRTTRAESFETFRIRVEEIATAMSKNENKEDLTAQEKMHVARFGSRITNSSVLKSLSSKLSSFSKKGFFQKDYDDMTNALKNKKTVIVRGEYDIVAPMMGLIISSLWKKRKEYKDTLMGEAYPPMIVVLDEAHIYAPKEFRETKVPLKQPLRDISREGRKYGMFLVCATQRISELDNTILSQMSTKIVLKTSQESDKMIIQKECGLSEVENNRLHLLDSGHGYIVSPVIKSKTALAFKARSNYTKPKTTINVFDELKDMKAADSTETLREYLLNQMPFKFFDIPKISSNYAIYSGTSKDINEIKKVLQNLKNEGLIETKGKFASEEYIKL